MAESFTLPSDHLVRATACGGRVRATALRAEATLRELVRLHDLSPQVTHFAGQLALATLLLSTEIKQQGQSLTLRLRTDGPLQGMTMMADAVGQLRGLVRVSQLPGESEGKPLDETEALGKGELIVIKDYGLKEPYVAVTPLSSPKLAETVALYLWTSEQIPSVLFLGLSLNAQGVAQAGGLLVQLLPDATEDDLAYIEARAQGGFPELSFLLESGFSPAQILDLFFGREDLTYLEALPLTYHCPCTRERMMRNLFTLPRPDLEDFASDPQGIELCCHFCAKRYQFPQTEIRQLLDATQHP